MVDGMAGTGHGRGERQPARHGGGDAHRPKRIRARREWQKGFWDYEVTQAQRREAKPKRPDDWGFTFPIEAVRSFYWAWRASNFVLTYEGGAWADESEAWWQDVYAYHTVVSAAEATVKKDTKPTESAGLFNLPKGQKGMSFWDGG